MSPSPSPMRCRWAACLVAACGLVWAGGGLAAAPPLHVLLVAVGDEQPVFDRFIADLARRFQGLDVASLATASSSGAVGRRLDTPADLYAAIRGLRGERQGDSEAGCLVYLTGHGTRAGLSMPLGAASAPAASEHRRYAALKPRDVAAALRQGCGEAPTIVVASACYSGVYLGRFAGVRDARRVVLTAAAPDRTSFGCGNDETHTYYDGCFLRSLDELRPAAAATASTPATPAMTVTTATWRELADRTKACVADRERTLLPGSLPSSPQSFFAAGLRDLPLPGPR